MQSKLARSFKRNIKNSHPAQKIIGAPVAEYLRLVWNTSRFTLEPAGFYARAEPEQPVIVAMWHPPSPTA